MSGFRIAISGAAGVGKTSLAQALATELKLPYLNEGLGPVVAAMKAVAAAQSQGEAPMRAAIQAYLQTCEKWLRERHAAMQAHSEGFVADRWAIDIMVRWLFARVDSGNDALYRQLAGHVQAMARLLDVVVVPPLLNLTADVDNGEGLRRNQIWSQRLHSHALLRGLLEQLAPVPRLYLPPRPMTVAMRVEMVLDVLKHKTVKKDT